VSFTDLEQGRLMLIFESVLTTFEASFIFLGSLGSGKSWLEHKIEPPLAYLAYSDR
jgi:hypothetical protein